MWTSILQDAKNKALGELTIDQKWQLYELKAKAFDEKMKKGK